jgi:hypothetical protein
MVNSFGASGHALIDSVSGEDAVIGLKRWGQSTTALFEPCDDHTPSVKCFMFGVSSLDLLDWPHV